jgi:hypothetical protein
MTPRETMRRDVETNGLECCGHPRGRHDPNECNAWMPGTRDIAPHRCGCHAPTPARDGLTRSPSA